MKKLVRVLTYSVGGILLFWTILTLWVERKGKAESFNFGDVSASTSILIVYDPDPFYDLDKQVCVAFAETAAAGGAYCKVSTVAAVSPSEARSYDAYVFCGNTYNWQPDWAITNFIENLADLSSKRVVVFTVGAGATQGSQRALESLVVNQGGKLIESRSLWLMRPNDESRTDESNVDVAKSMARSSAAVLVSSLRH
ncbi:MAG TPA: hypothetical protein VGD65_25310 [Chryseosolibacter sp.]